MKPTARKPSATELESLMRARHLRLYDVPAANALQMVAQIIDAKRYGERLYVLSVSR
jgi:hypothetical protein